jgi:hypothetical protein
MDLAGVGRLLGVLLDEASSRGPSNPGVMDPLTGQPQTATGVPGGPESAVLRELGCKHAGMDGWTWDQSVNIEGLATAAAAVGAAFAYVADLIARRRRDRKQRRRGARGRMILELIQSRYEDGVSEREIRRYLTSGDPECAALRTRYDVDKHDDSNEFEQDTRAGGGREVCAVMFGYGQPSVRRIS